MKMQINEWAIRKEKNAGDDDDYDDYEDEDEMRNER